MCSVLLNRANICDVRTSPLTCRVHCRLRTLLSKSSKAVEHGPPEMATATTSPGTMALCTLTAFVILLCRVACRQLLQRFSWPSTARARASWHLVQFLLATVAAREGRGFARLVTPGASSTIPSTTSGSLAVIARRLVRLRPALSGSHRLWRATETAALQHNSDEKITF